MSTFSDLNEHADLKKITPTNVYANEGNPSGVLQLGEEQKNLNHRAARPTPNLNTTCPFSFPSTP